MSRRGVLTPRQAQFRAASRMTVGTKMWTEQPVPEDRPRFVLPQGVDDGPLLPFESWRYLDASPDVGGGTPGASISFTLYAGEQTLLALASSSNQLITVAPGWEILNETLLSGIHSVIVTRTSPVDEYSLVCTVGPEAHPFNLLCASGFAITGPSVYRFIAHLKAQAGGDPVQLHTWSGFPTSYRLRVLVSRAAYGGWATGGSGHDPGALLTPSSSFWDGAGTSGFEDYLTATWPSGDFYADGGGGIFGPRVWVEWHIKVGRA